MLGNLSGGVLFQYHALALAAIPALANFSLSTAPVWVQYVALPLVALLLFLAKAAGRLREMGFAIAWMAVSLLPVALLNFRFFTNQSIPHTRYYYLSSFGMCLSVVVLLAALWDSNRMRQAARAVAASVLVLICVAEVIQVRKLSDRWHRVTTDYRTLVSMVEGELDAAAGINVCVLDDPLVPFRYLKGALQLERPSWKLVEGDGSREFARGHRPCLHLEFLRRGSQTGLSATRLE